MDDIQNKSITIEDINQLKLPSVSTLMKEHVKRNIFLYVILPILYVVLYFLILNYYFQLKNIINDNVYVVIFLAILPTLILYAFLYNKENKEFFTSFAKQLGFSFSPKGDILSVDGMLFKTGRSQSIHNIINGLYYNHPTRFYNFETVIGYGKSQHTESFKVLEVTFDTLLPEIILSRKFGIFSDMTISRDNEKRLSLEGDFDKYFNLYTIEGYENEVLQIFTPEIMKMFIDDTKELNVEMFGSRMYIYSRSFSADMDGLIKFYNFGKDVIINLDQRLKSLKGDVSAMEKYIKLT